MYADLPSELSTVQYESRHAGDTMTKQDLRISESLASHKNKKPGVMISKLQKATKREIEVYLTSVSAQILYPKPPSARAGIQGPGNTKAAAMPSDWQASKQVSE